MTEQSLKQIHAHLPPLPETALYGSALALAISSFDFEISGEVCNVQEVSAQLQRCAVEETIKMGEFFKVDMTQCQEWIFQANVELIAAPLRTNSLTDYSKYLLELPIQLKVADVGSVYFLRQTLVREFLPNGFWRLVSFWKRLDFITAPAFKGGILRCFDPVALHPLDFGGDIVFSNYFTHREYEVQKLVDRGLSSKQIAEILVISVHTVSTHRRNIRKKLKRMEYLSDLTPSQTSQ